MSLRSSASPRPPPRRRGRAAIALALVVGLLFVGVLFAALLAPSASTTLTPVALSVGTRPGEVKITVSHVDARRQLELLNLLDELAKQNLAEGVHVSNVSRSGRVQAGLTGSLHTAEASFVLAATDPPAVIGHWFDFDAFVENANFLCRPLFEALDQPAALACTVEVGPIDGSATLSSRVVRVDGTLRFAAPLPNRP